MAGNLIPLVVGEIMRHAFTRKNFKSKTTIASAATAAATTASIQAGVSPGTQVFPGDPEKAVILDALFYLASLVMFFWRGREKSGN